jgi:hypothetical protein
MRQWKVLTADRRSPTYKTLWPPDGEWAPHVDGTVELRQRGYHYLPGMAVIGWLREGLLAEVESCPEHEPKIEGGLACSCGLRVLHTWPLDARVLRLFACDCAERALTRERERGREPAPRSWRAVEVARLFAEGKATRAELYAAAYDYAAYAAYDYAAYDYAAANAAAYAAYAAADAAANAAAAYAAADAAANAAAYAREAEREWQYGRLLNLTGAGKP